MRNDLGLSSLVLAIAVSCSSVWAQQAGGVAAPVVSLTPKSLSFGNQPVGAKSALQTVTLTNRGKLHLTIEKINISSTDYDQTNDCPAPLPAGKSCTLSVTFQPTGAGPRMGVVRIDDNAAGSPHTINLSGTGTTLGPPEPAGGAAAAETRPDRIVNAPAPDTRPLSGAEEITVGLRHSARNYVLPSLQIHVYGDSNQIIAASGTRGIELTGSVVGRLAVQHVTRKSQVTLDYLGGGLFYSRNSSFNSMMHQFGITESIKGRRWGLMLGDRASFLPESPFGFYGFGGISSGLDTSLGNLNPAFSPNQTILSGRGSRVTNTTIAQLEYSASARSKFTASGSYGLLRFKEPGLIENDQRVYTAGYEYMATRKDTIGIIYGLSQMRFRGVSLGLDSHFVQLSYGRRVTGRVALQLAGGPQVTIFQHSTTSSDQHYTWNAHSSLHYRLPRADLGLSYGHYTTAGSGLLFGAQTDHLQGSVGWRFNRNWSGSFNPGYAHNTRLKQNTAGGVSTSFDSVYAGFGLRRALGRYMDASFTYSMHDQRAFYAGIPGNKNGTTFVRHLVGFGFNWHTRPLEID